MSTTQISEKRLAANRANAQKSTGPQTSEGKSRSSQNALRHAGYAQATLLPTDNPEEFAQFRTDWLQSLSPQTTPELYLTDRAVSLAWRLQRIVQADTTLYIGAYSPASALSEAAEILTHNPFDQLNKSEDRLQSMLDRTLKQLRNLQTQRQKSPTPPCPFVKEENPQNEPTESFPDSSLHENPQNEPTAQPTSAVACIVATPPTTQFSQNEPISPAPDSIPNNTITTNPNLSP